MVGKICALLMRIHFVEHVQDEVWDVYLKDWVPRKMAITREDLEKPTKKEEPKELISTSK